jgi:hypothetical protein
MVYYVPGTEEKDPKKVIMSLQQAHENTATNTSDIATNTSDIATNTANIATNTADIAELAASFVSAKSYGAVGDGVADDTSAIQAAVTASRWVFLPAGTYLISGTITLPADTTLLGAGPYSSVLVRGGTNQSYLVLGAGCVVEKVGMHPVGAAVNVAPSTVPSSGTAIVASSVSSWTIRDIWMEYVYIGISVTGVAGALITGINIHQTYANALVFNGSSVNDIMVDNFILHANNTTVEALIKINDGCEALMFSNGDVLLGLYSMFTTASSYTGRVHPAFCKFTNVYFDSSANGVAVDKADGFSFTNCWFSNSGASGVGIFEADDTRFVGCDIVHNTTHGAAISSSSAKRTIFSGCNISGNNVGNAGGDGVIVVANVTDFVISGCVLTNNYGTISTGNQRYGINISAGTSTNFVISGNDVSGNVTGSISNGATGTNGRIIDNIGYNPVGAALYSLPSSGVAYTAGPSPETHYLSGGTVSGLSINGVAIVYNGATTTAIHLGPNETFTVTYSVVPVNRMRDIH